MKSQQGVVLLVCLVILALMTFIGVASLSLGLGNLQVVGNMEQRNETAVAAQGVLEQAISTTRMFTNPDKILFDPNSGQYTDSTQVDVNGDGTHLVNVTLSPAPVCLKVQVVQNAALNLSKPNDAACFGSPNNPPGILPGASAGGASMCADTLWEINAAATEPATGASATMTQGVNVRVPLATAMSSC